MLFDRFLWSVTRYLKIQYSSISCSLGKLFVCALRFQIAVMQTLIVQSSGQASVEHFRFLSAHSVALAARDGLELSDSFVSAPSFVRIVCNAKSRLLNRCCVPGAPVSALRRWLHPAATSRKRRPPHLIQQALSPVPVRCVISPGFLGAFEQASRVTASWERTASRLSGPHKISRSTSRAGRLAIHRDGPRAVDLQVSKRRQSNPNYCLPGRPFIAHSSPPHHPQP